MAFIPTVRQTLNVNETNLANLILSLSHHLFTLLPSPLFPSTSSTPAQQDTTKEALNCLRVLGRIIVVVYEAEADARERGGMASFAGKWMWNRMKVDEVRKQGREMGDEDERITLAPAEEEVPNGKTDEEEEGDGQFKIEDSDSEEEGETKDEGARAFKAVVGNPPSSAKTEEASGAVDDPLSQAQVKSEEDETKQEEDDTLPCLVDRLFMCTIDLLFCAGFTGPDSLRGQDGPDKINVSIIFKGDSRLMAVCHLGERCR
jgi:hypothetical protein